MVAIFESTANRRLTKEEARREAAKELRENLRVASQQAVLLTQLSVDFPTEETLSKAREAFENIEICLKNARVAAKTVRRNLK